MSGLFPFPDWLDEYLMSFEVIMAVTIILILLTATNLIILILLYTFGKRSTAKYSLMTYFITLLLWGGLLALSINWENMTDKYFLMWILLVLGLPYQVSIMAVVMTMDEGDDE